MSGAPEPQPAAGGGAPPGGAASPGAGASPGGGAPPGGAASPTPSLSPADAETFSRCMSVHGVAVFPADTVYGLACEPDSKEAVRRLYGLKGRRPDKPAAGVFFDPGLAPAPPPQRRPRTPAAVGRGA